MILITNRYTVKGELTDLQAFNDLQFYKPENTTVWLCIYGLFSIELIWLVLKCIVHLTYPFMSILMAGAIFHVNLR